MVLNTDSIIVSKQANASSSLFYHALVLLLLPALAMMLFMLVSLPAGAEDHSDQHSSHVGHSDALMVLLGHKIALQKLQAQLKAQPGIQSPAQNLTRQSKIFHKAMPVLRAYMDTPKSYYLTTQMYHDSLENRAAMLADFTALLVEYQKQLVSLP